MTEFGGKDPRKEFEAAAGYTSDGLVAVVVMLTGPGWAESVGVVGHARSWRKVERLIHDNEYRIMRKFGDVSAYIGEEQGYPDEKAVIIVTVHP